MSNLNATDVVTLHIYGAVFCDQFTEFKHDYQGTLINCLMAIDAKFNYSQIADMVVEEQFQTIDEIIEALSGSLNADDELNVYECYIQTSDNRKIFLKHSNDMQTLLFVV